MAASGFSESTGDVVENATTTTGDSAKKNKKKQMVALVALAMLVAVSLCIVFSQHKQQMARHELSATDITMNSVECSEPGGLRNLFTSSSRGPCKQSRSLQLQCNIDFPAMASGIEWLWAQAASAVAESLTTEGILTYVLISAFIGQPASIDLRDVNKFVSSVLVDSSGFITIDLRVINNCVQSLVLAPLLLLQQSNGGGGLGSSFLDSDVIDYTPIMLMLTNIVAAMAELMNSLSVQKVRIGGLDTFTKIDLMKLSKKGNDEAEMISQFGLEYLTIEADVMPVGSVPIPSTVTYKEKWSGINIEIPLVPKIIAPIIDILENGGGSGSSITCIVSALMSPQAPGATLSVAATSGDALSSVLGGNLASVPLLIKSGLDFVTSSIIPSYDRCFPGLSNLGSGLETASGLASGIASGIAFIEAGNNNVDTTDSEETLAVIEEELGSMPLNIVQGQ